MKTTMTLLLSAVFVLLQLAICECYTIANSVAPCRRSVGGRSTQLCLSSSPLNIANSAEDHMVADKNGKSIEVGTVVRVASGGLKAFQVPAKGRGYFDDDKQFVTVVKPEERQLKCLQLPVGLRGVVTKVYNYDEISANHPVQVKFVPGQHASEGYDAPVAFLMHFSPEEIELVE